MAPAAFLNSQQADRGMGDRAVMPLTDMAGALRCTMAPGAEGQAIVNIANQTSFDWQFGSGRMPFKLGIHIRDNDDKVVRFDDGTRVAPGQWFIPAHGNVDVPVDLKAINRAGLPAGVDLRAEYAIVQDGHAWFDQLRCHLPLPAAH
jgi:hypothetical protein